MKQKEFTFWGSFSDLKKEKKYLGYTLSEIQTKNRIAVFAGGIGLLLVGISDFGRIGICHDSLITSIIRISFFLYSLYLFIAWKQRSTLRKVNTGLFIYTLLVGNLITLIIFFLNEDKNLDTIDLITVPLSFLLVYVFIIIPSYFIVISGIITTIIFLGLISLYENIDNQTVYILSIILLLINGMGFYINNYLHKTRRMEFSRIREINKLNTGLHEEIEERKSIQEQLSVVISEITDSMRYANHLQISMLPDLKVLKNYISDYFIMYQPCGIVSGDFYWLSTKHNKVIIATADCTGHGIRAGFMSFIAITLLEDIVNVNGTIHANEILNQLRENIIRNLRQNESKTMLNDGLDIALCVIDKQEMTMEYAGAFNPLLHIRNYEMTEYKADRMPISYYDAAKPSFTNHIIPIKKGDIFYIFTDGYSDQFGGSKNKKFMHKKLKRELLINANKPMDLQREVLFTNHMQWKGNHSQTDDIILLGFKI